MTHFAPDLFKQDGAQKWPSGQEKLDGIGRFALVCYPLKSLLNYRDPHFWTAFAQNHWKPRVPTVIRQPFAQFPLGEDLLLRAMKGFEAGLRAGDLRKHCLVSVADKQISPRRPLRKLFGEEFHTLEGLEKTADRVFSKNNFGLMVTNMHAVDAGIWNAIAAFIQDARHCIHFPVARAFLDLFYGRYSSNFTGLHKDTQEIFAFVVRGQKRMLAWPFDYFLSRSKEVSAGDRYFNKRLKIDHRKYRQDAIVLDAEAGDLIYWPSDYWHVAESRSDKFSAMLSLGILQTTSGLSDNSGPQTLFKDPISQDVSDAVDDRDAARRLRWLTGFGFEIGGPIQEAGRKDAKTSITLVKNQSGLIYWKVLAAEKRILVSASGHSVTLSYSHRVLELLQRLAAGETVSLAYSEESTGERDSKVIESNWNKQILFKSKTLTAPRDPCIWLAHWLVRVAAAEREGAIPFL